MIIERIKNITLFVLVSLSLFLTYQLWYGQKPTHLIVEEAYERVIAETPRSLEQVITPAQIILRTERGRYLLKESDRDFYPLWEYISQLMQDLGNDALINRNIPTEGSRNLLTLHFHPPLPVGQEMPWFPENSYALVADIDFYSFNNQKWLVLQDSSDGNKITLLLPSEKAELLGQLIAVTAVEPGIIHTVVTRERLIALFDREISIAESFYVPQEPVYMDRLMLKPETVDRNLLLKTFFIDYSLARIIEEKDGGLIYTDGERGLRLTDVGLEYSYPRMETGQTTITFRDALVTSSNLISYHGGWPLNLRLEKLEITGRGRSAPYMAEWRMYYQGYPLYTKQPTRAIFNDRGLIHYIRTLFLVEGFVAADEENAPAADWSRALQKALQLYDLQQSNEQSDLRLENLELGYVISTSANTFRGEPVWFIQINGTGFYLEAVDLNPLSEEGWL